MYTNNVPTHSSSRRKCFSGYKREDPFNPHKYFKSTLTLHTHQLQYSRRIPRVPLRKADRLIIIDHHLLVNTLVQEPLHRPSLQLSEELARVTQLGPHDHVPVIIQHVAVKVIRGTRTVLARLIQTLAGDVLQQCHQRRVPELEADHCSGRLLPTLRVIDGMTGRDQRVVHLLYQLGRIKGHRVDEAVGLDEVVLHCPLVPQLIDGSLVVLAKGLPTGYTSDRVNGQS